MRFTFAASTLALASSTLGLELISKSSESDLTDVSISSIHEGAAINYFFFSTTTTGEDLTYSKADGTLGDKIGSFDAYFQVYSNIVELTPGAPTEKYTFADDGALQLNGSSKGFYAAKNTNDPYQYSKSEYQLLYYADAADAPEGAIAVTLYDKDALSSTSSSSSSSAAATSAVTSTASGSNSSVPAVTTYENGVGAGSAAMGSAGVLGAIALALLV